MKKWICAIIVLVSLLLLIIVYAVYFENRKIRTAVKTSQIDGLEKWVGDTYINGQKVDQNESVIMQKDDTFFISISSLQKYVSDRFIHEREGNWYIRQNVIESIQIYQFNGIDYLPLAFLEAYMHPDEHYFARGIIQMHTYLPVNINWDGTAYTLTTESEKLPDRQHRSVTIDGRRLWIIDKELWIESDDGLIYRYSKPLFTIN